MAADSIQGGLAGRSWDALKSWELGAANQPTQAGFKEDVMKLPREDMSTLGRFPAWDSFTLVTCDKCNRNVKIEALESHVAMRHATKSERSAYHRVTAARAAALLSCQVRLTSSASTSPQHSSLLERLADPRTLPTSTSGSSLGSAGPASPQTHCSQHVESTTPTRTPSPVLIHGDEEEAEQMETSPPLHPSSPPPQQTSKQKLPFMVSDERDREREKEKGKDRDKERNREREREKERVKERTTFRGNSEADSTTNNVISIPESEDMPNIEIISDGMDLLNTKFSFSSTSSQQPLQTPALPAETPPQAPPSSTPGRQPATSRPSPAPSSRPAAAAATEPMEVDQNAPPAQPTHYITVSPLGKCGGSPRKMVIGRLPAAQEKKVTGREREYDPNRHCGVWDSEQKRNCTRSLTCKSHSVYLKRKVINRTGPFDELLAQHKAEKEATVVRSSSVPEMPTETSSSILATRLKLPTGPLLKQEVLGGRAGGIQVLQPTVKPVLKDSGCDDSLHYTTDHPKPLAVCTFGGKRIGGLFITDRPRLFTRKVMKLAIGRSNVAPARQQALPYIVNFQSGGVGGLGSGTHTIKLAPSLPAQQIVVQEAFKTDLGDFKGGLKFELGGVQRQLHHHQIVPSVSDGGI